MAQEDKELLLKDICARLPYGVKTCTYIPHIGGGGETIERTLDSITIDKLMGSTLYTNEKPYLRPMSSMTEDEKKDVSILLNYEFYIDDDCDLVAEDDRHRISLDLMQVYIDWLNSHHFDYRGLIEKYLAIAITEENNPYKE